MTIIIINTIIITILIAFVIMFLLKRTCNNSFRTESGKMYSARDIKAAEMISFLQLISKDLIYHINEKQGKLMREKLQNTSFIELFLNVHPNIYGWNYDKGREIGIRLYHETDIGPIMLPPEEIINTLFHELAHSMTKEMQHPPGGEWENINAYLQSFAPKYVEIFKLKIFFS